MADTVAVKRARIAWLIMDLRRRWIKEGRRGKWARFRMAWLMDKRLGLHPALEHSTYNRRPYARG